MNTLTVVGARPKFIKAAVEHFGGGRACELVADILTGAA